MSLLLSRRPGAQTDRFAAERAVSRRRPRRACAAPEALEPRTLFAAPYVVMDLGALGGSFSSAADINNSNQVVGAADTAAGSLRAFRFKDADNDNVVDAGEMVNLSVLTGDAESQAASINDSGQVVGTSSAADGRTRAVRFDASSVVTDLGLGDGSAASGINAAGAVVGGRPLSVDSDASRAFLRAANGTITNLPLPAGYADTGEARAINDAGVIVGASGGASGEAGFIYNPVTGTSTAVGFAGAAFSTSSTSDVNRSGQVAGDGINSAGAYRAFRVPASSTTPTSLGIVGSYDRSNALGINVAGDVVGSLDAVNPAVTPSRAFLFSGGLMRDLNTQIAAGTGWVLNEARAINDNGYIVGTGTKSGLTRAFVLVPAGPAVTAVSVNGGAAQRSRVSSLSITFNQTVAFDAGAFTLTRRSDGAAVTLARATTDNKTFTFTMSGALFTNGSLADGVYDLTVVAFKTHAGTLTGTTVATDRMYSFHRLFSDSDGDGDSDNADLFQIRSTYNKFSPDPAYKAYFDSDNDGDVDNADVFQIRSRRNIVFQGY